MLRRSNAPPPGGNRPRQRAALVLAGLAALALPCTPLAAETAEPGRFTPPAEPLLLTRTVIRPLRDGAEIVVVRRYRIRFVPQDSGYRLDGELVGSAVEAPPALASLAALLREQPEPGPFPAAVDRAGMILPAPAGADRAPGRAGAVAAAGALLAHNGAGTAPELRAALQTMATATPGSGWPAFLFNPGPGCWPTAARARWKCRSRSAPCSAAGCPAKCGAPSPPGWAGSSRRRARSGPSPAERNRDKVLFYLSPEPRKP